MKKSILVLLVLFSTQYLFSQKHSLTSNYNANYKVAKTLKKVKNKKIIKTITVNKAEVMLVSNEIKRKEKALRKVANSLKWNNSEI